MIKNNSLLGLRLYHFAFPSLGYDQRGVSLDIEHGQKEPTYNINMYKKE